MLCTKSFESKSGRPASSRRRFRGYSQVIVLPSTAIPPKLMYMRVDAEKNDVFSTGERVAASTENAVGPILRHKAFCGPNAVNADRLHVGRALRDLGTVHGCR
jgi:hypothetical protein